MKSVTETIKGTPLLEIVNSLTNEKISNILLFIVDGLRADSFYNAIDEGTLPHLKSYLEKTGYCRFNKCVTSFPSVTVSTHTSILTGAYPGFHGIVGNEWFIRKDWMEKECHKRKELFRATREYVKFSVRHPYADPGLANGIFSNEFFNLANADLYPIPTLYEGFPERSISIHEIISRGAWLKKRLELTDWTGFRGYLATFINVLSHLFKGKSILSFPNHGFDRRSFHKLRQTLKDVNGSDTRLIVTWLPGMDGFSHSNGALHQGSFFKSYSGIIGRIIGEFDLDFKRTIDLLAETGQLEETLIVFTSDHGQYDCKPSCRITTADLYRLLKTSAELKQESIPLSSDGNMDENSKDATIIAAANGGCCYIYTTGNGGWDELPKAERMMPIAQALSSHIGIELIFIRSSLAEYKVWRNGVLFDVSSLSEDRYPLKEKRLRTLASCQRSGDMILVARSPYYFENGRYNGQHGRLNSEDSLVPLLFIHKKLQKITTDRPVETVDITPTLIRLGGDDTLFNKPIYYKEGRIRKLNQLFDTLEAHLKSDLYRMGFLRSLLRVSGIYSRSQLKKDWQSIEEDLTANITRKLEGYRNNKLLDDETIELYERKLVNLQNALSKRGKSIHRT